MTNFEQRECIARFMDMKDIHRGSKKFRRTPEGSCLWATHDPETINYAREYFIVPDYPHDLNALRCVEEKIRMSSLWIKYCENISQLIDMMLPYNSKEREGLAANLSAGQKTSLIIQTIQSS